MRKFLSLVLALVMAMSLVTISAGAADFTDADSINYKEAVDVMETIGIIDGYADGGFGPQNGLSRGAAAKIICNLVLGPTTAKALPTTVAPFSDVAAGSTYAGYVAWCSEQGIINGYADGTFRPGNSLSGYAFMKMLLGALGYDGEVEGFTGGNWKVNVAKLAVGIGLDSGLKEEFNGEKHLNREEAMLFAFNMLKADMVEYDNKTNITIGDATINVGGGNYKSMRWQSSSVADGNIDGVQGDGFVQFAELYFNKLVKTGGDEAFSRPSTTWTWKGVKIGTYANSPKAVYSASVPVNTIYADLGMVSKDAAAPLYVNGNLSATVEVSKANDTKLKDIDAKIGNGTIIEAYLNGNTNDVTLVAISVYGGKVAAVRAATSTKDAYVVVDGGSKYPALLTSGNNNQFETEDFAEDDVVAYTFSEKAGHIGIKTMEAIESVTGKLDKRVVSTSLTIEGTTYKYAKEYTFDGVTEATLSNKASYVVYLDENGYALWIEEDVFTVEQFALVLDITNRASGWTSGNEAKLLFTDGKVAVVKLDADYITPDTGKTAVGANDVVTFRVNDKDQYVLTNQAQVDTDPLTIRNKAANIAGTNVDSKTVFVVETSANTYKAYTGIKNVPDVASAKGYTYAKSNVAKVVFALDGTVSNTSKDVVFLAGSSVTNLVTSDDTADYYVYNAVNAGEITSVMVKYGDTLATSHGTVTAGEKTSFLLNTIVMDSDDIITTGSAWSSADVSVHNATGVKALDETSEVRFGTAGSYSILSVANDVNVYEIDALGVITEIELGGIVTDSNDTVIYTMEDGEVTNIFVQLVK